jgi:hypothetical protein
MASNSDNGCASHLSAARPATSPSPVGHTCHLQLTSFFSITSRGTGSVVTSVPSISPSSPPAIYHLPPTICQLPFSAYLSWRTLARASGLRVSTQKQLSIYYASNIPTIILTGTTKCLLSGRFIYLGQMNLQPAADHSRNIPRAIPSQPRPTKLGQAPSTRCENYHEVISRKLVSRLKCRKAEERALRYVFPAAAAKRGWGALRSGIRP